MDTPTRTITLPISQYVVTLRTRLPWGEKNDVEQVMKAGIKGVIVDGKQEQTVDGSATQKFMRKMLETLVRGCVDAQGQEIQINIEVDKLDSEDGDYLMDTALEIWNVIKKKQTPTTGTSI